MNLDGIEAATMTFPLTREAFDPGLKPVEHTGFSVGPFFVHLALSDNETASCAKHDDHYSWHVTHRASGFAVQKSIPTHVRALWLARKLLAFDVWGGSTKDEVLAAVDADTKAQIDVLRTDAANGDCQGEMSA